ncbi:MAG: histidinol-phosphate transaminase [Flavobacteriales bacterium]
MNIEDFVRENVKNLKPYSSARDEFKGKADVFLDANESPFNTGLNRYPSPMQWALKNRLAEIKNILAEQVFLGNGSDEPIDLLFRVFCEPGKHEVIIPVPTYGMYKISAEINNVAYKEVFLTKNFQPNTSEILSSAGENTRILFLCSPNNPTGNLYEQEIIEDLLKKFKGIVVVDEAYVDFSDKPSWITRLGEFDNLVVLQTFSKAWGLAGIRLGMAFASKEIIGYMNKIKPPYNVNTLSQRIALEALNNSEQHDSWVTAILAQREILEGVLPTFPFVQEVYPTEANFILIRVNDARKLYNYLIAQGIVVRDRSSQPLCESTLRISVGTLEENVKLLESLKAFE